MPKEVLRQYISIYCQRNLCGLMNAFVARVKRQYPDVKFSRSVLDSNAIARYLKEFESKPIPVEDLHHPVFAEEVDDCGCD